MLAAMLYLNQKGFRPDNLVLFRIIGIQLSVFTRVTYCEMQDYQKTVFSTPINDGHVVSHDVYTRGDQPGVVVIIQELPGIGPETLKLATILNEKGFRVVLPHLFGPLGRVSMLGNFVRVFCMRREFHLFAKNQTSPIVDWLKALCRDIKSEGGVSGVGVIGMCLTGNFAMSLVADDAVLAGVASQPSMPLNDQSALHMSEDEVDAVKQALDIKGSMLALRFEGDRLCRAEKFEAIDRAFNSDKERVRLIELPGKGHSVLTLDFIKGGEPAEQALQQLIAYFAHQLNPKAVP